MGKKRIVTQEGDKNKEVKNPQAVSSKKKFESGILFVQSTYNNTKVLLTDPKGNALAWS